MNKTSEYRGVSAAGDKWRARITVAGEEHYLGTFTSEVNAAAAYDEAAKNFFGDQAKTNFTEYVFPETEQTNEQEEEDMNVTNFRQGLVHAVLDQNTWEGALQALDVVLGTTLVADHLEDLQDAAGDDFEDDFFDEEDEEDGNEGDEWDTGWEPAPTPAPKNRQEWYE